MNTENIRDLAESAARRRAAELPRYMLTAIRKNLPGHSDYIWIARHANERPMIFTSKEQAYGYYIEVTGMQAYAGLRGPCIIAIPEKVQP